MNEVRSAWASTKLLAAIPSLYLAGRWAAQQGLMHVGASSIAHRSFWALGSAGLCLNSPAALTKLRGSEVVTAAHPCYCVALASVLHAHHPLPLPMSRLALTHKSSITASKSTCGMRQYHRMHALQTSC